MGTKIDLKAIAEVIDEMYSSMPKNGEWADDWLKRLANAGIEEFIFFTAPCDMSSDAAEWRESKGSCLSCGYDIGTTDYCQSCEEYRKGMKIEREIDERKEEEVCD